MPPETAFAELIEQINVSADDGPGEDAGALAQEPLDAPEIEVQPSPQSPDVAIDRDAIIQEARRVAAMEAGWEPDRSKYRGPREAWLDENAFLAQIPTRISSLRDQSRRMAQVVDQTLQDARQKTREETIAELRRASETGDTDAAIAAADRLIKVADGPSNSGSDVALWKARNTWFETNPAATAWAVARSNELKHLPTSEQLSAVEREAHQRFPELLPAAPAPLPAPPAPAPVAAAAPAPAPRTAPLVQGGARNANGIAREPTLKDLPAGVQADYKKHFSRVDGMTEQKYVKAYLAEQER